MILHSCTRRVITELTAVPFLQVQPLPTEFPRERAPVLDGYLVDTRFSKDRNPDSL